jgi:hypothetical protein
MPILKPEIQKALRAAGLTREVSEVPLSDRLEVAGLGLDSTLEILHDLAHNSGNENTRRQAIETVLKLHQVLKDQPAAPPSVTIVIQDPHMVAGSVNPILIPRDTTKQKETIQ